MQEDKVDDGGIEMKIPKIDIIPVGNNWKKDEIAGILLVAYRKTAQEFLRDHPKDCYDCPAFKFNQRLEASIQSIQNYLHVEGHKHDRD